MFKTAIFFSLFCFSFQGQYLFNNKKDSVFFSNYVNELFVEEGTPLCFDGTLRIHPTDKKNSYLVEVLDTVTRDTGKLNIAAYTETPEGGREKIFIDKFSFIIKNSPQPTLYLGNASQQEAQSSGGQEEASSESTKNSDNNAENVENVDYEVVDDEKDK